MSNPWFRMYTEFAFDPKVQILSEVDQRRYLMLLCMRGCNVTETLHVTMSDEQVTFVLRISMDEWKKTKSVLLSKNLILDNNSPASWDKRQFISDTSAKRVANDNRRPSADVWRLIRTRIFKRDDYTCQYCGSRGVKLECDHIHPVSLGGHHGDDNLTTACFRCNRSKRAKTLDQWRSK